MANRLYVITAEEITETGMFSFKFMFDSGSPFDEYSELASLYGFVKLVEKGENEINPFEVGDVLAGRQSSFSIGPDGSLKWQVFVGDASGQQFYAHVNEAPPGEEGLAKILKEAPDCVLLINEGLWDRFKAACISANIDLGTYHYTGILSTS